MKGHIAVALASVIGLTGWATAAWAGDTPADSRPTITAIQAGPTNVTVTVNVPAGLSQVALESRTRLGAGAWVPRAVQLVTGPCVTTFQLARSEQLEVLRVRGDTATPLPAAFFKGQTNFAGQMSSSNPTNSLNAAVPGAVTLNGGAPTDSTSRTVVEPDIWVVRGHTVYFFNQYRGLQVIDMSQPDAPVIRGTLDLPAAGEQMYLVDDQHALLLVNNGCGSTNQALVVDVSGAPRIVASISLPGYTQESRLVDSALYVASSAYLPVPGKGDTNDPSGAWEWGTAISSFDLSNPAAPVARSSLWYAGWDNVIVATDQFLFAVTQDLQAWWQSDVQIVDISAPDGTMQARGSFTAAGYVSDKYELNFEGDLLTVISSVWGWYAGGANRSVLETVSLSNPAAPQAVGELDFAEGETLTAARFDGQRAYVTTTIWIDPLWVVDLSDPKNPRISGSVHVPGYSSFIQPLGDRLVTLGYVGTNGWRVGVSLFDVHDSAQPTLLSQIPLGDNYSWSEATYDDKAFAVLPDAGLILVPYQGWSSNGYAAAVQLLDLGTNALTARGVIDHVMPARRVALLDNRIVSVSGTDLLVVSAADRDHPAVTADTELSWPANQVLLAGGYLIEIADAMTWGATPNPALRVVSTNAPESLLTRLDLTNGLAVVGATLRHGNLYLLQAATDNAGWILPADNGTNAPAAPTNTVLLSVFDLAALPALNLIGQAWTATDTVGWNPRFQPLWLATNRLVWAGSGGGWGLVPMLMASPAGGIVSPIGGSYWWPWWIAGGSGQLFACDVTDGTAPRFTATVNLATNDQWWAYTGAFAAGNLVYLSHEASEFLPGVLLPGQTPPTPVLSTNADGTVTNNIPQYGTWVTKFYLNVVDFTDLTTPTVRQPVNIPGSLGGLGRGGALIYTTGLHWDDQGNSDGIARLDASAYDGVSASLVASLKLDYISPPMLVLQDKLLLANYDSAANTNRLETWNLTDAGAFVRLATQPLESWANSLTAFGNLLALQLGSTIDVFDATDPAALKPVGSTTPTACVWGDVTSADGSLVAGLWVPLGDYGVLAVSVTPGP